MVILGKGNYLKTDEVKVGEKIKIKDEGQWIESKMYKYDDGNPKVDFFVQVDYLGEEKSLRLNKTNRDILIEALGNDTSKWVGKEATLEIETILVAGKRRKMLVVNPGTIKATEPNIPWDGDE